MLAGWTGFVDSCAGAPADHAIDDYCVEGMWKFRSWLRSLGIAAAIRTAWAAVKNMTSQCQRNQFIRWERKAIKAEGTAKDAVASTQR